MYNQAGGVYKRWRPSCTCCGVKGTNKLTCPWNPENAYRKAELLQEGRHKSTKPLQGKC